jgi:hypothetical protein
VVNNCQNDSCSLHLSIYGLLKIPSRTWQSLTCGSLYCESIFQPDSLPNHYHQDDVRWCNLAMCTASWLLVQYAIMFPWKQLVPPYWVRLKNTACVWFWSRNLFSESSKQTLTLHSNVIREEYMGTNKDGRLVVCALCSQNSKSLFTLFLFKKRNLKRWKGIIR